MKADIFFKYTSTDDMILNVFYLNIATSFIDIIAKQE